MEELVSDSKVIQCITAENLQTLKNNHIKTYKRRFESVNIFDEMITFK